MEKLAFLIFAVLFCSLNLSAQTKLTQEEYAVYASVLKVLYNEYRETYSNKSEFVILNETNVDPELDLPSNRGYKNLVKVFGQKNAVSGVVEKKFPRGAYSETYYLVSQTEVDELLEKGRIKSEENLREAEKRNPTARSISSPNASWTVFYEKYPESSGVHTLSRVGFSGQFAMVQVRADHSWNGFSRNYILKKVKGKWKIVTSDGSEWIS